MTFTPPPSLAPGTTYIATVGTGAADAAGNNLGGDATWSFRTIATVITTPSGATRQSGSIRGGTTFANLRADDNVYFQVTSTSSGTRTSSWYGTFTGVANDLRSLVVTYKGKNSRACSQTVQVYNWSRGSWVLLDSRSVGTTEVQVQKSPSGTLADYVSGPSGTGDLRVRVRCTRSSGFYASADLLTISFTAP